jgi:hypothetical protein
MNKSEIAEEAAREIVNEHIDSGACASSKAERKAIERDAIAAIKLRVERAIAESQAWIPVEEKLPTEDERIVVWNSGTGAEEHSTFADGRFIDESGTNTDLTDGITHWKPLADPPKGNEIST